MAALAVEEPEPEYVPLHQRLPFVGSFPYLITEGAHRPPRRTKRACLRTNYSQVGFKGEVFDYQFIVFLTSQLRGGNSTSK